MLVVVLGMNAAKNTSFYTFNLLTTNSQSSKLDKLVGTCSRVLNLVALRFVHELCKIETEKLNIEVRVEIGMV